MQLLPTRRRGKRTPGVRGNGMAHGGDLELVRLLLKLTPLAGTLALAGTLVRSPAPAFRGRRLPVSGLRAAVIPVRHMDHIVERLRDRYSQVADPPSDGSDRLALPEHTKEGGRQHAVQEGVDARCARRRSRQGELSTAGPRAHAEDWVVLPPRTWRTAYSERERCVSNLSTGTTERPNRIMFSLFFLKRSEWIPAFF